MVIKIENNLQINEIECNNDLETLRTEIRKIDLTMPGVHILDVPPGTGKSYRVKEILKGQNSFILATATHKLLGEEYKGLNARHWRGLNEGNCEQYQKIKNLKEERVPISILCRFQGCKKNKCTYWRQFNTKKAICPHELLMDDKIRYKTGNNKGKLKFDILALDESLDKYYFIKCNKEHVISSLNVIKQYSSEDICDSFIESIDEMDHYLFEEEFFDELYEARSNALRAAIYEKSKDNLKKITQFDIYTLRKFYYYTSIHPSIKTYSEPALYRIFDLAREGIPIILLDATFDEKKFRILLNRYIYEDSIIPRSFLIDKNDDLDLMPIGEVNIKIHRAHLTNKNITINRLEKDNLFYKNAFFGSKNNLTSGGNNLNHHLREFVKALKKRYKNVGVITYKSLEQYFQDMVDTEYFYNLKGSNKIKNADVVVLIGTPQLNQKEVIKQYNQLFLTDFKAEDIVTHKNEKTEDGHYFHLDPKNRCSVFLDENGDELFIKKRHNMIFEDPLTSNKKIGETPWLCGVDYDLSEFEMNLVESEIYQAIHRARLFRSNDSELPEVFILGHVAERVKEEFQVKYLNKKETNNFFSKLQKEAYPAYIAKAIINLFTKYGDVNKVAKELSLYKRSDKTNGYNTKFINAITEGKVSIKNVGYLQGILNKHRDIVEIMNQLPDEKLPEWFIRDSIYYVENGDFINWTNI